LVYFSLRYSFLPAIAAILKVRKLHAGESTPSLGVIGDDATVVAFPEEVASTPVANTAILEYCTLKDVSTELSGVYYLHFSGLPLNVL
jgi:hypothetical protein